jgi:LysM repeat protein
MRPFYRIYVLFLFVVLLLTSAGLIAAQQPATTPEPQQNAPATPTPEIFTTAQATPTVTQATATLVTTATFTPAQPTQQATAVTLTQDVTYTVARGDRLIKIAERYGVSYTCVARVNRIINPNLIYVGQELLIPASCQGQGGGDVTDTSSGVTTVTNAGITGNGQCQFDRYPGRVAPGGVYTIRAGDTLDYIACDFGIALTCLQETNPQIGENRGRIHAGDTITINLSCPAWDGAVIP